jgi:hypothetical protein
LAVEVGGVPELGVGGWFLRRRRTSVRCEIRPLRDWNEHGRRKEKVGTYRIQIREREMGVLVREVGESGQNTVETGEGERNVLGQFLSGIDTG